MIKIELKVITRELRQPRFLTFMNFHHGQNFPKNSSYELALFTKENNQITRAVTPLWVCAALGQLRCNHANITQALLHYMWVWFLTLNFSWGTKCQQIQ
jgi:hypothetical protein